MKGRSCSHKMKYEGYLKLICICLSDDMYTELAYKKIPYGGIVYVYGKTIMIVV